ncbi:MAG TPA: pyridoxamine 5'-phosphate oxidase family protein [Gaiellaceae bacterium]
MVEALNVDPGASEPLPWSRAVAQLEELRPAGGRGPPCWLATARGDGRPHVTGVVGHWLDDTFYFVSGPSTRKARNLAADSRCTVAISLANLDLVLEGAARRVNDEATVARIAERFSERGWPLTVEGDLLTAPFQAPTAPQPPWHLYALTPKRALGIGTAGEPGATRWTFPTRD